MFTDCIRLCLIQSLGIVVSVLPILVALVMPDLYLGDETAAGEVSEEQVAGGDSDSDSDE